MLIETKSLCQRELHRDHIVADQLLRLTDHRLKVCVLMVRLVHDQHEARAILLGISSGNLTADFHALHGTEHHDSRIGDTEGCLHLAGEVSIPRGIQNVDLRSLPLRKHQRGVDRDLPFDLIGMVVREGVPFFHFSLSCGRPGGKQYGFGE